MIRALILCVALAAGSCRSGPDPIRLAAEEANLRLAQECARGWFEQLPAPPHRQKLINDALADWARSIAAERALLNGTPVIPVPPAPQPEEGK